MAEGTGRGGSLSIWFFAGLMLLLYGLVLFPFGAWEWFGNHEPPTVLHQLHPTFWWGCLLTLFGGFYVVKFRPAKRLPPSEALPPLILCPDRKP